MTAIFFQVFESLGYATASVFVMGMAMWLLLAWCRVQSPAIQRFAWLLVLAPGVVVWRMSMVLPVLPAREVAAIERVPEVVETRRVVVESGGEFTADESFEFADAAAATQPAGFDWRYPLLLGGWVAGMVVVAGRFGYSYVTFARGLPPSLPGDAWWEGEVQEVCDELSIRRPITLHVTRELGPALCWLPSGYRLLVPRDAWRGLSGPQRRAILRHELAHLVRGDLWKSFLARLLAWPQWFNPLAWLAVSRFEEAAEWACDDAALASESEGRFDYLRALVELGQANLSTPALHAAIQGGSLHCRVRRLLSPTGKDSVMKKIFVLAAAMVLAAGGFARIRLASAQAPARGGAVAVADESALSDAPGAAARVASATAASSATKAVAQGGAEAFVDLQRVMKESYAFNQRMSPLQKKIQEFDQECKEQVAALAVLREETRTANDAGTKALAEKTLAEGQAKFQLKVAAVKKQFLEGEAKIYHEAFEEVRATVAEYAKQHGIRVVRRRSASNPNSLDYATDEPVDTSDRMAMLARINRPVLYGEVPADSPVDITEAILERLNGVKTR